MNGFMISIRTIGPVNSSRLLSNGRPHFNKHRLLRNEEPGARKANRKAALLAMLDSVHRDVSDARAAVEGDHSPEATERLKHMLGVVDQIENVLAEG